MSKPISPKTEGIILNGYSEDDYAASYWLEPNVNGERRIDRSANHLIEHLKTLIERGDMEADTMVLDIGAGPGNMVNDFMQAGFAVEGCEYSTSGRSLAKKIFGLDIPACDLRGPIGIPYESSFFDYAYCVGVLTMIPEQNISTAISECARILVRGGILLVNLMNPVNVDNEPHITSLPHREWHRLFKQSDLEDITSILPPQQFGIGVKNEFCGIFRKRL